MLLAGTGRHRRGLPREVKANRPSGPAGVVRHAGGEGEQLRPLTAPMMRHCTGSRQQLRDS